MLSRSEVDAIGPRLSFFFAAWTDVLEEVAKFRAARRIWATIMRDRFGAKSEKSMHCRFHVQTAGSALTAQSIDNNVVRAAYQALAAVRDTVRLLSLPRTARQDQRPIVVLNRVGMPGGLTRRQIEEALKMRVDVAIPDQPRQVGNAATLGEPAMNSSNGFRAGIQELAKLVGGVRMLDSDTNSTRRDGTAAPRKKWSLFRKKEPA